MLSINLENDTIDLPQMIADRTPRLAFDREDVGFLTSVTVIIRTNKTMKN